MGRGQKLWRLVTVIGRSARNCSIPSHSESRIPWLSSTWSKPRRKISLNISSPFVWRLEFQQVEKASCMKRSQEVKESRSKGVEAAVNMGVPLVCSLVEYWVLRFGFCVAQWADTDRTMCYGRPARASSNRTGSLQPQNNTDETLIYLAPWLLRHATPDHAGACPCRRLRGSRDLWIPS